MKPIILYEGYKPDRQGAAPSPPKLPKTSSCVNPSQRKGKMMKPKRIQRKRTKGWRKPENAVIVTRGTKWGNPFVVGKDGVTDAGMAVDLFERYINPYRHQGPPANESKAHDYFISIENARSIQDELRGRDLCCWCPLDQPCHADVLLEIANVEYVFK